MNDSGTPVAKATVISLNVSALMDSKGPTDSPEVLAEARRIFRQVPGKIHALRRTRPKMGKVHFITLHEASAEVDRVTEIVTDYCKQIGVGTCIRHNDDGCGYKLQLVIPVYKQ